MGLPIFALFVGWFYWILTSYGFKSTARETLSCIALGSVERRVSLTVLKT